MKQNVVRLPYNNDTEVLDFAKSAKFKTSGTGTFIFFNPDKDSQIRITKNNKTGAGKMWYVTLHPISEDNITYNAQTRQIAATSMQQAKQYAGLLYFEQIRK